MPGNPRDQEAVDSLPPSCRYVLDALQEADEPLTYDDLDERLCHQRSTIEWAVRRLNDSGHIALDRKNDDLRQVSIELRSERTLNTQQSDRSQ